MKNGMVVGWVALLVAAYMGTMLTGCGNYQLYIGVKDFGETKAYQDSQEAGKYERSK